MRIPTSGFLAGLLLLPVVLGPAACTPQKKDKPKKKRSSVAAKKPKGKKIAKEWLTTPEGKVALAAMPDSLKVMSGVKVETVAAGMGKSIAYDQIGRFNLVGMDLYGVPFANSQNDEQLHGYLRLRQGLISDALIHGLVGMKLGETRRIRVAKDLLTGKLSAQTFSQLPEASLVIVEAELLSIEEDIVRLIKPGTGEEIKPGQSGAFHYTGLLADGKVFDTSREPRSGASVPVPAEFALQSGGLIPGWVLCLPGMKIGERRWIHLPSGLSYGKRGNPQAGIDPDQDLIFEVELVRIAESAPPPEK